MSRIAILSDIHGNLYALEKVIQDMDSRCIDQAILLGDLIDYGMQSNEVVAYIMNHFHYPLVCSIWGNHEKAILTSDFNGFSSQRGVDCAKHTASLLTTETTDYLNRELIHDGFCEFSLDNKKALAIHGSLDNPYWKAIMPGNLRGDYRAYDIVLSGHSHYPHVLTEFYDNEDPVHRNKHAVIFINPGSVGQPRNHNPAAQYAILDTDTFSVSLIAVKYDVVSAMALYDDSVDSFYRTRLETGV